MARSNVLREYLVRLGFNTDAVSFGQFKAALRESESLVDNKTMAMASSFLKFQGTVTSGFAAAGAAALGVVDKVAMADQDFRLLALRMFTTKNNARELKIAMDELGQPLENIAWDPELASRFNQLIKDQRVLAAELGPNFEHSMRTIRDIRFELNRFSVEAEYLSFNLVQDFAKIFGINPDNLLDKMRNFNSWFQGHMPEITAWIEGRLKPVMDDMKAVLGDTWDLMKQGSVTFQNLVGALSGDKSLEGTTASFDKLSASIEKSIGLLKSMTETAINSESTILHLLNAASFAQSGNFSAAKGELGEVWKKFSGGSLQAGLGKIGTGIGLTVPCASDIMNKVGVILGGDIEQVRDYLKNKGGAANTAMSAAEYAKFAAASLGIPASWILAQEKVETGNFTSSATAKNNLGGIMSKSGGIRSFSGLDDYTLEYINTVKGDIARYGRAPRDMADFVNMLYSDGKKAYVQSGRPQDYLSGMQRYERQSKIEVGEINISLNQPNATPKEIAAAVTKGVKDGLDKQVQRGLQELNEGWSY